ncbi:MAG: S8 family serine peptidase [Blastocatellia bacterium]
MLRAREFDPLKSVPEPMLIGGQRLESTGISETPVSFQQSEQTGTNQPSGSCFIIQFHETIRNEWINDLRARGFEIAGYAPNNAFIVRQSGRPETELQAARRMQGVGPHVRWVGAYGPGLKVDVNLGEKADRVSAGTEQSAGYVALSFVTFRGEIEQSVQAVINTLNLEIPPAIEARDDGRVWGMARLRAGELTRTITTLARYNGIEWIEERRQHRLFNDSGVRVIQAGAAGSGAPLYARGLTGAGQIFGNADSGVDADHAQFRLNGQAASQTLSTAVTTQQLSNGQFPVSITNPANKIIAYYLLGQGALIDNAANPNGGKSLDPNARSGGLYINSVAYDDAPGYHGTHTTSVAVGRDYNADGTGAVPGIATRTAGDGVAPDARMVFQDVGHPSQQLPGVDGISQALLHAQAYNSGVRAHNNSYGPLPPVPYDQDAADIDDVMWRLRDYNIFFSAGNDSAGVGKTASVAKNNIVVAATESPSQGRDVEDLASYSNHGPTQDGRIKPDIAAPGFVRAATESSGIPASQYGAGITTSTTGLDAAVNPASPNHNRGLSTISGTSFSSPIVAGGALLVRQYFVEGFYPTGARTTANGFNPSNALVKAIILNSGQNMKGRWTASEALNGESGPLPNFGQGWGRVALDDALFFTGDQRELRVLADIWNGAVSMDSARPGNNTAISTGGTHTYQLTNVSTIEPLRITLVWSDPRASLSAQMALVNNLDLEVTDPQGRVFRGNVNFSNAWSQIAGATPADAKNPVEAVYIQYPQAGTYTVRVTGTNVPGNGQMGVIAQPGNQPIDSNRQGYALVATGNFTAGARSLVRLDTSAVDGGVNADRFISRNETATARVTVINSTVVPASNVSVQLAVDGASETPAGIVRINGNSPGQPAVIGYGNLDAAQTMSRAFQITLLDDGVNRAGQKLILNATMTPANGSAFTSQFVITIARRIVTYRTRFEPQADTVATGVIVIPVSAWGLRPDNPNPASAGEQFANAWQMTAAVKAAAAGSTASLGDPSGVGTGYAISVTSRGASGSGLAGVYDDNRWWTTRKILLPGLTVDQATDRVGNAPLLAQLNPVVDSFDVDVRGDFTGDAAQGTTRDGLFLRIRTYQNTAAVSATDDSGFNTNTFSNLLVFDSLASTGTAFQHYGGNQYASGTGAFAIDTLNPNNSDVAFRLELQFRRNGVAQTGEGVFVDNLNVRLRLDDLNVYTQPATRAAASVDAASYARDVAPGQILATFGSGFPAQANINQGATTTPLPTQIGSVSVRVNGRLAPVFYALVGGSGGAFQVNYQLPYETAPGIAFVEVLNNGAPVTSEFVNVSTVAPSMFTVDASGRGQLAALNQDNTQNGNPAVFTGARPESRGRFIVLYGNGQGMSLVDGNTRSPVAPVSGAPATALPLLITERTPIVTIGGVPCTVGFSGLAPGFVGLWQLNILIPQTAPAGNAVPVVVSLDGKTSLTTTVAIN